MNPDRSATKIAQLKIQHRELTRSLKSSEEHVASLQRRAQGGFLKPEHRINVEKALDRAEIRLAALKATALKVQREAVKIHNDRLLNRGV